MVLVWRFDYAGNIIFEKQFVYDVVLSILIYFFVIFTSYRVFIYRNLV